MGNYIKQEDRYQVMMFPPRIEDLVPRDHPSRVIDSFVESLDFNKVKLKGDNDRCGRPRYNPKVLIKLLLYGYSINMRSSRALEKLSYDNISAIWLTGNSHPDFSTIARFRSDNLEMMKELLKYTIELYLKINLRFEPIIYVDGTKLLANASDSATVSEERIQRMEKLAEKILLEAEEIDMAEDKQLGEGNSGNKVSKEALAELQEKIAGYKKEFARRGGKYNSTDPDAVFMRGKKGLITSYNGQISVDDNGVILEADVTNKGTDNSELRNRISGTEANTGVTVEKVVADSGYFGYNEVKELLEEGKGVIVKPTNEVGKERGKRKGKFEERDFIYREESDTYLCPDNKELRFYGRKQKGSKMYRIYKVRWEECMGCRLRSQCCSGRGVRRLGVCGDKAFNREYGKIWLEEGNRKLYRRRKYKVEPVFGVIKSVLKFRGCSLRGLDKVKGEWNLIAAVYNLMKLRKLGIQGKMNTLLSSGSILTYWEMRYIYN